MACVGHRLICHRYGQCFTWYRLQFLTLSDFQQWQLQWRPNILTLKSRRPVISCLLRPLVHCEMEQYLATIDTLTEICLSWVTHVTWGKAQHFKCTTDTLNATVHGRWCRNSKQITDWFLYLSNHSWIIRYHILNETINNNIHLKPRQYVKNSQNDNAEKSQTHLNQAQTSHCSTLVHPNRQILPDDYEIMSQNAYTTSTQTTIHLH